MFRLNRNERSHWSGNGVHVESELVFMIGRNMHAPRPAKYKYAEDGQEKTWTGQGRMPKAIAEAVANGRALEEFLI
ncbi:hypothetical protein BFG06_22165 [Aeromonas caviae]|nr:hypothetical protein BFG06_22165 [Aeromonas caviae]